MLLAGGRKHGIEAVCSLVPRLFPLCVCALTFDPAEIAEGEPGKFWHVNDQCDVRVDTYFC